MAEGKWVDEGLGSQSEPGDEGGRRGREAVVAEGYIR